MVPERADLWTCCCTPTEVLLFFWTSYLSLAHRFSISCSWFVTNNNFWPKNVLGGERERLQRCYFIPTGAVHKDCRVNSEAELSSPSPSPQNSAEGSWGCPPNQLLHTNVSLSDFFPLLTTQKFSQAFQRITYACYPSYTGFLQSRVEHLIKFGFAILGHKKSFIAKPLHQSGETIKKTTNCPINYPNLL